MVRAVACYDGHEEGCAEFDAYAFYISIEVVSIDVLREDDYLYL